MQKLKSEIKSDKLRQHFIDWKNDEISDEALNEVYSHISNFIWYHIHAKYTTKDNVELFHQTWFHVNKIKDYWDETKDNYVSTWLHFVIKNYIINANKSHINKNERYIEFSQMSKSSDIKDDFITEIYIDHSAKQSQLLIEMNNWIEQLTGMDKKYVQLMIEPTIEQLNSANKKKKYNCDKLSKENIAQLLEMEKWELDIFRTKIRKKLRRWLNDSTNLLFHGGELPCSL